MARLPDVTAQRPAPRNTRGIASISPGAASAVADAFQDAGRAAQQIGLDIQDREATAAAKEADVRAAEEIRKLLYDPETGFANQRGGVAVGNRDAVSRRLDEIAEAATEGLNPRAKAKAKDSLAARVERSKTTVDSHTAWERTTWINGASDARIAAAHQDALANPDETDASVAVIDAEIRGKASRNGWAPERLAQETLAAKSKLYADQAEVIGERDPVAAMEYVRSKASSMLPTDVANLEKTIGRQERRAIGEAMAADTYGGRGEASYFAAIRSAESGGNDSAKNPKSSATGRYQFTEGTWSAVMAKHPGLGLTADGRTNPEQQERAIRAFTADNAKVLAGAGIPATNANLYAAHFLGAGGALNVLLQPDSASVADHVGKGVVSANGFLEGMTVGDFRAWTARKAGGGAPSAEEFASIPDPIVRDAAFARYRELQAMDAGRRKQFEAGVDEDVAYTAANGVPPPNATFSELRVGQLYEPAEAEELRRAYTQAMEDAQVLHGVTIASEPELAAQVAAAVAKVQEPGFTTEDVNRLNGLQGAIQKRNTAVQEDPAGYVQRSFREAASTFSAYAEAPPEDKASAAQSYVAATDFNYDRIGVPMDMRTVLPKQTAASMAKQFNEASPDVAAQQLVQFATEWGDAAPRVMRDLRGAGLAPEYAVAMRHADNPGLAAQIVGLRGLATDDITKGMVAVSVTDTRRALSEGVAEYVEVFQAGDVTGEATKIINETYAVAEKMALKLTREGMDPAAAAEQAAADLFPEGVMDEPNAKVILPKGTDDAAVSRMLDRYMSDETIRAFNPAPMDDPNLPEFADREVMIEAAQNGMWLTNSQGDGAVLHLNVGGYFIPVVDDYGRQHEVLFGAVRPDDVRVPFGAGGNAAPWVATP